MTVGRNEECTCGSGKKYKKCCALAPDPVRAARSLDDLDAMVVHKLARMLGPDDGEWLMEEIGERASLLTDDEELPMKQLLLPWALYEAPAHGMLGECDLSDAAGESTIAAYFAKHHPKRFDAREHRWLEAQARAKTELWEVIAVAKGLGITVENDAGQRREVIEKAGSALLRRHHGVLGRLVEMEGLFVFCGMYPLPLGPTAVASYRRLYAAARKNKEMRDALTTAIIVFSVVSNDELRQRAQPPALTNTDGEAMLWTRDHFTFPASARADVLRRLTKLSGCERVDDDAKVAELIIKKPGNAMHPSWDNTVLGRISVDSAGLVLETNSVARGDAWAATLATALDGVAARGLREHEDLTSAAAARRPHAREPMDAPPPKLTAMLAQTRADLESAWPTTPNPQLGGRTPRQAMRSKSGREAVGVLFKQMEHDAEGLDPEAIASVGRLRAMLKV